MTDTMSTAEAMALRIQAAGLDAELNRWQRLHPATADPRVDDALEAARLLTHALDHLATGTQYEESATIREEYYARHGQAERAVNDGDPIDLSLTDSAEAS